MILGFEEKETKGGASDGRTKGNRAAASLTFSCGIGGREEREEKKNSTEQAIREMMAGRESHGIVLLVCCWRTSRYGIDGHCRKPCYGEIKD